MPLLAELWPRVLKAVLKKWKLFSLTLRGGDSWLPLAAPRRSQSVILIYKQFNLRNAAKWGAPSASCCSPRESRLLSCCGLSLGSAPAQLPAGSAPSCHSPGHRGHLGAISAHARGRRGHWMRAHMGSEHSTRFLGKGDNPCFIHDLFSVSPLSHLSCSQPTLPAQLWLF